MNACPICGLVRGLHGSILPGCTCASGTWTTQKKEWVGLTDDEIDSALGVYDSFGGRLDARKIEAKLKEKNT